MSSSCNFLEQPVIFGGEDADINLDCAEYDKLNDLYYMFGRMNSEDLTGSQNEVYVIVFSGSLSGPVNSTRYSFSSAVGGTPTKIQACKVAFSGIANHLAFLTENPIGIGRVAYSTKTISEFTVFSSSSVPSAPSSFEGSFLAYGSSEVFIAFKNTSSLWEIINFVL